MNDYYKKFDLNYKNLILLAVFVFIFFYFLKPAFVVDYTVTNTGFSDIQGAITGSSSGDQILLGNQVYSPDALKNITVNVDNIVIRGQSSSSKAVLNGSGSGSRIMWINGDNIRLKNFIFRNSDADVFGGALTVYGTNLTIINCEFFNDNGLSGTIFLDGGADNVLIQRSTFTNNIAAYSDSTGGGSDGAIDSHSSNGKIINCVFNNNSAIGGGRALYFIVGTNNTIFGCRFNNTAAPLGAAIVTGTNGTILTIISSNFTNNKAVTMVELYIVLIN